jgi:serine/threonine protein phosphatase PrpC
MVVSDGHGSPASPRSGLGSTFAVRITTEVLWQLPHPISSGALAAAVATITSRWTNEVKEHLHRDPLTAVELEQLGIAADTAAVVVSQRPTVLYGATLLFAVVSGTELAVGQLGDGDVVLVDDGGQTARPLPIDPRLLAHVTTSLSDDDAVSSLRTTIIDATGYRLTCVSSDGLGNSYANDAAFLQFGQDVLRAADKEGIDLIRDSLPRWLAETTREGSGDDISVAIAVLDPSVAAEAVMDRLRSRPTALAESPGPNG